MRYLTNDEGYVTHVSFGANITCDGVDCSLYEGPVPAGYANLGEWYVGEAWRLYRWKIVGGELTLDASAAAPVDNLLWSGSWASGSIKIEGLKNYKHFDIYLSGKGTVIPATLNGTYLRGAGSYPYSAEVMTSYEFAATVSGETATLVLCVQRDHTESGHGSFGACTVTRIEGVR